MYLRAKIPRRAAGPGTTLRAPYAVSGTDTRGISLRASYAVSGTERAHAGTREARAVQSISGVIRAVDK
eukprot:138822-Rhodomonas_salina.1